MTDYKTTAQRVGLPEKLLWKMHRAGIVANPLREDELRALEIIRSMWRTEWFLRMALAEFSHARRMDLIQKPELTRVERYVLKCYLNAPEKSRISTRGIINLVEHYLNATVSHKQVLRIRSIAYSL